MIGDLTAAAWSTASRLSHPNTSLSQSAPPRFASDLCLCIKLRIPIAASAAIDAREEQLQLRFQHGGLGVEWGEEYLEDERCAWCKQCQGQG